MNELPGIGIFGTSEVVKVLVPILIDKGLQLTFTCKYFVDS